MTISTPPLVPLYRVQLDFRTITNTYDFSYSVAISELEAECVCGPDKKTSVFLPSPNTRLRVELSSQSPDEFPLQQCKDCLRIFDSSAVVEAAKEVKWKLLHSSTYDLLATVSLCIRCAQVALTLICMQNDH